MMRKLAVLPPVLVAAMILSYFTVPSSNTSQTHFDALIVLGTPTHRDGTPADHQIAKVDEAAREFRAGRAEHIIMTGGAAHNRFVEAETEAKVAIGEGIPAEDVLIEGRSMDTAQNLQFAWEIMQAHGWKSAEIISYPNHLPRAALLAERYQSQGLEWTTHATAFPPGFGPAARAWNYGLEMVKTAVTRWFGIARR